MTGFPAGVTEGFGVQAEVSTQHCGNRIVHARRFLRCDVKLTSTATPPQTPISSPVHIKKFPTCIQWPIHVLTVSSSKAEPPVGGCMEASLCRRRGAAWGPGSTRAGVPAQLGGP